MAQPMKTIDLHYPMIQFLIIRNTVNGLNPGVSVVRIA